ncbi:hypothetical protein C2L71_04215 [Enteroscipio rubneri]|uniref:Uncharacterized protein n=1 Tax=Enteroscipio rubneri TaxID=2070686 RepID=A0A2K2UCN7_9ACTN|nr:hypothetical protein C2L71_04215 [Enteroscipio rubneri]
MRTTRRGSAKLPRRDANASGAHRSRGRFREEESGIEQRCVCTSAHRSESHHEWKSAIGALPSCACSNGVSFGALRSVNIGGVAASFVTDAAWTFGF